jgi:hypothetical protein
MKLGVESQGMAKMSGQHRLKSCHGDWIDRIYGCKIKEEAKASCRGCETELGSGRAEEEDGGSEPQSVQARG